jgi:hypothetical protein
MRFWTFAFALGLLGVFPAAAADYNIRVELNTFESTDTHCRMTFVIENKSASLETLKLDLVVFNTESIVYRRIITEMGPVGTGRTIVKIYQVEGKCAQLGAVLVNDVTACIPGKPAECLDGLALSSRIQNVRLYK